MVFSKRLFLFIAIFFAPLSFAAAQDKPIGYWESHLPYNTAVGVATDGSILYTICDQAFFTYSPEQGNIQTYSKVEGMSDLGMQSIAYDSYTGSAVLVYTDGNIDVFKNNTFYNIPDFKLAIVSGNKAVYQAYTENGIAYLSTSVGILLADLTNHDILETYQFIVSNQVVAVTSFTADSNNFYAVTTAGLYTINKNSPDLQNYQAWQHIDSTHSFVNAVTTIGGVFFANSNQVFKLVDDTLQQVFSSSLPIAHLNNDNNGLIVGLKNGFGGKIILTDTTGRATDSFTAGTTTAQALQLPDGSLWVAALFSGLQKRVDSNSLSSYVPAGPSSANNFSIYANNRDVWIAHGGFQDNSIVNNNGGDLSNLDGDTWKLYEPYVYPLFDSVLDMVTVLKDETDGTVYAGSYESGLCIIKKDGTGSILKQNSIFDSSISIFGSGQRQVLGLALDHEDDLWVSTLFSAHPLYVKTKDSMWYAFKVMPSNAYGGPLVIDNNDQIWMVDYFGALQGVSISGGVTVYNTNGTISDPSDDTYYHLQSGAGYGNLPSNNVFSIACDLNNNIWIGTDNGIGIVSGCSSPFSQSPPCDAQIPIVQYDQFAGYLFAGENVRTIAVDGANRKWVGTDNGVWLLSPDASQIIYRFTAENSPLPSDNVRCISVDKITGDVYIGTQEGLISYRSTATEGNANNQNIVVFPDPVPSGYGGTIAIKGLTADADVRITDINGQLVYRTTAFGGQAIWNGLDYKGHRPSSGVYLVFAASSDGSQVNTGKMVFMQ